MEDKISENEKLRKQIQFLTDVIEDAKTKRHDRTQHPPYRNIPAHHVRHGQSTSSYRPSFKKASSHPYFPEWDTRHNTTRKAFSQERSHNTGLPSESTIPIQSKLQYVMKGGNTQTNTGKKMTEIKCRSSDCPPKQSLKTFCSIDHPKPSLKNPDNVVIKTADNLAKAKLLIKSDTDIKPKNLTNTTVKHISVNSIGVHKKNEDITVKPSFNLGSFNSNRKKSSSSLLQDEIEKMHSKIANLKKALQNKQISKSSTVIGKGESDKEGEKKPSVEIITCKVSAKVDSVSQKVKSCVERLPSSVIKQELCLSANSKNPVTESGNVVQKKEISISSPDSSQDDGERTAKVLVTHAQKIDTQNVKSPDKNSVKYVSSNLEQPANDLVLLSKYKLTRLATSPTKYSPIKSTETVGASTVSVKSAASNLKGRFDLDQKPIQPLTKNQTDISIPAINKGSSTLSTPAKFIKKSKYSITRVKSSGKKGSGKKKLARSQSKTPAKFVSFSKYALKRVRRSLSDENKQILQKDTDVLKPVNKFNKGNACLYSFQPSIRVLRSKFKMEKVKSGSAIRSRSSSSDSATSYKFNSRVYPQRNYGPFTQRYQNSGQYRRTDFGYSSYFKRGSFYGQYKGQGWSYHKHGVDRYGMRLPYHSYTRRHAVGERYLRRLLQRLRQNVPFNPKHRLDRRTGVQDQTKTPANFIMINGMLYRSNAKTLVKAVSQKTDVTNASTAVQQSKIRKLDTTNMKTVTVRGVKFKVDHQGRSLRSINQEGSLKDKPGVPSTSKSSQISRVDIGGVTYVQTKPGTLERVGSVKSRMAATRVINKTVQRAAAKYRKDNTKILKTKKYCMFYNRFGKCNKKGSCTYIHDPEKVAVCTRFLRGTCKVEDCLFSHKVSKDKMPVCSYFLKGVCNRDKCPYLHVNVNRDAEICQDFVKGYCPLGEKCKKKHILKCPEFTQTGSCSKGEKCTLQHRRAKRKPPKLDLSSAENSKKRKVLDEATSSMLTTIKSEGESTLIPLVTETNKYTSDVDSDIDLPFKERKLPAYISLKTNLSDVKEDVVVILDDDKQIHTGLVADPIPDIQFCGKTISGLHLRSHPNLTFHRTNYPVFGKSFHEDTSSVVKHVKGIYIAETELLWSKNASDFHS